MYTHKNAQAVTNLQKGCSAIYESFQATFLTTRIAANLSQHSLLQRTMPCMQIKKNKSRAENGARKINEQCTFSFFDVPPLKTSYRGMKNEKIRHKLTNPYPLPKLKAYSGTENRQKLPWDLLKHI
jgi:hypothetical protein